MSECVCVFKREFVFACMCLLLTSEAHHSWIIDMMCVSFICRVKAASHSGSISMCCPTCLTTGSIPYICTHTHTHTHTHNHHKKCACMDTWYIHGSNTNNLNKNELEMCTDTNTPEELCFQPHTHTHTDQNLTATHAHAYTQIRTFQTAHHITHIWAQTVIMLTSLELPAVRDQLG